MNKQKLFTYSFLSINFILMIALLFFVVIPTAFAASCFTDTEGHWAEAYICWLFDNGLSTGFPDGTFRPADYVNRAQMAVFLQQLSGHGTAGQIVDADTLDGQDSTDFSPSTHGHSVTRDEYLNIPGAALQCALSGGICNSSEFGYKTAVSQTTLRTVAPVHIPQGATITEFTCYWLDNSLNVDMDIYFALYRHPILIQSSQQMASISSSSSGTSILVQEESDTTITTPVVDNEGYGYYIYSELTRKTPPDLLDGLTRNHGCRIKYSLTVTMP